MSASNESTQSETNNNEENLTDELGYDIEPEENNNEDQSTEETPPQDDKENKESKEEDEPEEVKDPATGYGDDDDKPEDDKPDDKEEPSEDEKKAEEERVNGIKEVLGNTKSVNTEEVTEFAVKNKMTKDQVQAFVNLVEQGEKDRQAAITAQRATWKQELKSDPEFGGENFDRNVKKVENIIEKHLPNWKKELTNKGGMLPSYIMKDLLSLDKVLNPKAKLEGGDPPRGESEQETDNQFGYLDEMYD